MTIQEALEKYGKITAGKDDPYYIDKFTIDPFDKGPCYPDNKACYPLNMDYRYRLKQGDDGPTPRSIPIWKTRLNSWKEYIPE